MLIERTSSKSILPEAVEVLFSNESAKIYSADHSLRPPLGIYNISLLNMLRRFCKVLDELNQVEIQQLYRSEKLPEMRFDESLIDSHQNLLLAIKEHFDECEKLVQCFFPSSVKVRKQPEYETYFLAVTEFFDHISEIANHFKHHQGRLTFFAMFSDQYSIPGYFVESIDKRGIIVPHRKIHKPVLSPIGKNYGYDTAFSFYRDLRFLFWGIFFVSHHLAMAIRRICTGSITNKYPPKDKMDEQVVIVAERIAKLPTSYFPDELEKDAPTVAITKDDDNTNLRLMYPDPGALLLGIAGNYIGSFTWMGDGVTKSHGLMYEWGQLD